MFRIVFFYREGFGLVFIVLKSRSRALEESDLEFRKVLFLSLRLEGFRFLFSLRLGKIELFFDWGRYNFCFRNVLE